VPRAKSQVQLSALGFLILSISHWDSHDSRSASTVSLLARFNGTGTAKHETGKHANKRAPAAITSLSAASRCASRPPSDPSVIPPSWNPVRNDRVLLHLGPFQPEGENPNNSRSLFTPLPWLGSLAREVLSIRMASTQTNVPPPPSLLWALQAAAPAARRAILQFIPPSWNPVRNDRVLLHLGPFQSASEIQILSASKEFSISCPFLHVKVRRVFICEYLRLSKRRILSLWQCRVL